MTNTSIKKLVKERVQNTAFEHLKNIQQTHSKIKFIRCTHFHMQPFMCDQDMDNDDISLLFALRTKCVRGIKTDFIGMFVELRCTLCHAHEDSLAALLLCEHLKHVSRNGFKYSDVYSQIVHNQRMATLQYRVLIQERERILEERAADEEE